MIHVQQRARRYLLAVLQMYGKMEYAQKSAIVKNVTMMVAIVINYVIIMKVISILGQIHNVIVNVIQQLWESNESLP